MLCGEVTCGVRTGFSGPQGRPLLASGRPGPAQPVGDATVVLRGGGPKSAAYGIHGGTAAVMAVSALLLIV